jgi:predicted RNA-binding protein with PUA-like domain
MGKPRYWLIKSEPDIYPYRQLERDKRTDWTGVRNFEARNNLRAMHPGDLALYYHSVDQKALVGVARVVSEPGPDPTAPGEDWASVVMTPHQPLNQPLTLAQVKAEPALAQFPLVTRSRLSVAPVSAEHFALILRLTGTKPRSPPTAPPRSRRGRSAP